MKITILGCGSSAGAPTIGKGLIGGNWGKCNPQNPKNRRTRASILIEHEEKNILIDTSPDLRSQLLPLGIQQIDAILYTHDHADHTHGIDEIRNLYYISEATVPYPIFGTRETLKDLQKRFFYLFENAKSHTLPILEPNIIKYNRSFKIGTLTILPFEQDHGKISSTGYRLNNIAYSTDVKHLDDKAFEALQGLDLWIVDCLSEEAKPTHSHLAQTLEWIDKARPKQAILTHLSALLDYEILMSKLPQNVVAAYDGMEIII